jgi:hypothetical protein
MESALFQATQQNHPASNCSTRCRPNSADLASGQHLWGILAPMPSATTGPRCEEFRLFSHFSARGSRELAGIARGAGSGKGKLASWRSFRNDAVSFSCKTWRSPSSLVTLTIDEVQLAYVFEGHFRITYAFATQLFSNC